MFFKKDVGQQLIKNREKIIRKDVKKFKKLFMNQVKTNIKYGSGTTILDFFGNVNYHFLNEISEIVLKELAQEHKEIEFSFYYDGFQKSYKNLKAVIKNKE